MRTKERILTFGAIEELDAMIAKMGELYVGRPYLHDLCFGTIKHLKLMQDAIERQEGMI